MPKRKEDEQREENFKKPEKSKRKLSIDEFSMIKKLRPEVKAGFKMWVKSPFNLEEEWNRLYKEYSNR